MIARIWHGWTKPENTKAYEDMLRDEIFPGIARRKIKVIGARNYSFTKGATRPNSLLCCDSIRWRQ